MNCVAKIKNGPPTHTNRQYTNSSSICLGLLFTRKKLFCSPDQQGIEAGSTCRHNIGYAQPINASEERWVDSSHLQIIKYATGNSIFQSNPRNSMQPKGCMLPPESGRHPTGEVYRCAIHRIYGPFLWKMPGRCYPTRARNIKKPQRGCRRLPGSSNKKAPAISGKCLFINVLNQVYGGAGGSRTLIRQYSAIGATCLARSIKLIRSDPIGRVRWTSRVIFSPFVHDNLGWRSCSA